MFAEKTTIRVRYCETDQMGHANNGVYPAWFEVGRSELFRKLSMPYSEFEKKGIFMPLVEIYIKFHFPAHYDEIITVSTIVKKMPSVSVIVNYEIRNENGKLLATGETKQAFLDAKTMRPVRIPEFLREDIEKYFV